MGNVNPQEFGKLQGKVDAIATTLDAHTALLEKLDTKLDGVVTESSFARRTAAVDKQIADHAARIEALEQRARDHDASFSARILSAAGGKLVAFIASGIIIFALATAYVILREEFGHAESPRDAIDAAAKKL